MSTIVTRSGKGSALTFNEVDTNFTNLNTDKYQSGNNVAFGTISASGLITANGGVSGALNGSLGATTPSTVVATTGTFSGKLISGIDAGLSSYLGVATTTYGTLASFRAIPSDGVNPYLLISTSSSGVTLEENGSSYGSLMFNTSATERMRIPAAGGVQAVTTISVGNATPSASGAGITFPATQSASTDANTLDDYEEGTWTPVLGGSGGTSGQTYGFRQGKYTKVGNAVTCEVLIQLSATGTITGNLELQGLPFAISGYIGCSAGYLYKWTGVASSSIVLSGNNGDSKATFYSVNVGGTSSVILTTTALANDSQWAASFSYLTT